MSHEIFMPALSSTMTEGKIVEWLKNPGDKVERGESVLVVESDKADMDVESFQDGYLAAVLMPAGSTAPVGETIGLIVEKEDEIASVQSKNKDKESPVLNKSEKKKNEVNNEAEVLSKETSLKGKKVSISNEINETQIDASTISHSSRVLATPKAKKIASQMGVDLLKVKGSGPRGRIQADDVLKAKGQPISVPWIGEGNTPVGTIDSKTSFEIKESKAGNSFGSPGETIKFNTLQKAVNKNMESSLEVPCFRVGYSINTDKLDSFYKKVKENGVTMTAILVKAVAKTLNNHPQVNARFSKEGIDYPEIINIAVAVAMEGGGLITPVLKDPCKTDLFELSREWKDLVKRSRLKQLEPDEYSSGTFTLSNLGMFGVDRFDAILPPGTGAILAVAASKPTVLANENGSISVNKVMQVNLTADHRIIYGADGAAFLKDFASLIENEPEALVS
ncbi:MAG: branched-chain alpha-keto acid dehydrogenase subunit E2 [Prochlorococcus sp. SP3034]|nr:branched-chain alpha-keto acid dehydrogenase subunit E2 [Prochlorococcus sp. SP3034]|tara:strand:+ start:13948 stop:15294 length:1347 start_codon:yes stop_codon:yes gene_type:complete